MTVTEKQTVPHAESACITTRSFLTGLLMSAIFAGLTVYFADRRALIVTATQIPVLPYVLLLATVLLINPVCRWMRRVRPFSAAEILIVFSMGLVSSGISTFGMTAPLVPIIGSLFNRSWNTEQSEWHRHVVPFLSESFFLSEPGIRAAAQGYAVRHAERQRLQTVVDMASRNQAAREHLDAARRQWQRVRDGSDGSVASGMAIEREARAVQVAAQVERQAAQRWDALRERDPELPGVTETLAQYQPRLAAAEIEQQTARERLRELEQAASEKVEVFRRGLPRHLRAYPGFVKLGEDSAASYLARFRRMVEGRRAAAEIRELLADLEADPDAAIAGAAMAEQLETVRERLERMADTVSLRADLEEKTGTANRLNDEIASREEALRSVARQRREAVREDIRRLQKQIEDEQRQIRNVTRRRDRVVAEREFLQRQLEGLQGAEPLVAAADSLARDVAAGRLPDDAVERLRFLLDGLPGMDGCVRRYFLGDVPWRAWMGPLLRWALVIGLTYLVLMTFNVLIFRQWAHNEKLIYPLAELPMFLAGHGADPGAIPRLFRGGLFWTGAAISGAFLGYNTLVATRLIPGLSPIDLRNAWWPYLPDTPLQGLMGGEFARSEIFFTMIGLSFLIPKKVSFSLWFFTVLAMVQVLVLVGLGYGQNERSFPWEWWYTLNFRSAQGGGALIVFSSVVLFKCRHYLLCAFSPETVRELPPDERRELRVSSALFLAGSVGIVLTLWRGMGAHLGYTLYAYFLIMIITIGLIRAVAEGGLLGFKSYFAPFHLIRTFFGLDKSWTAASLFAPLIVYYTVLFLDIKAFIAPAMANSLKIRDEMRMRRGRFHLAIAAAIAVAAVVSVLISVMMAYARGADLMSNWFYTGLPRSLFNQIGTMVRTPPVAAPSETGWVVVGAAAMAALLYFRQTVFWLPHPIGMIMLINPAMGAYWFSILIGWLAKSLVTKYGNKETYAQARTLFIGLIVGELTIVVVAMVLAVVFDIPLRIDLNRN